MNALTEQECVHVVVGIVQNTRQEVLISRRKADAHLGGLLEFPGGKVEKNETSTDALRRELVEELNIDVSKLTQLIQIPYSYSDKKILLDAYMVNEYSGKVCTHERQEIFWKPVASLSDDDFPSANYGVLRALRLPKIFPVTPSYTQYPDNFLRNFEEVVRKASIRIIQLRSHELEPSEYIRLAKQCIELCKKYEVDLILNTNIEFFDKFPATGLHLTSDKLLETKKRPLSSKYLVGASCHNSHEIGHAKLLGLDYMILGPVIEKQVSENCKTLGWEKFSQLAKKSLIPVYAIGGLGVEDLATSVLNGGQGIAAIRNIWAITN